ncbi:unnamed protein product [Fraxinus pennsylvanica]|uniref:Alpha 1,4-glycosyltransferase domain-containing protein n=1 Tax=Fraxinus pennsylvanica TaxID=56036 RepID=A0AAD2ACQ3_9LAMI|nr:unnamed protein product [Fraxinus pennsylvanica]
MEEVNNSLVQFLYHLQRTKRSFYAFVSIVLLFLLTYNSATIFHSHVPFPAKNSPDPASFEPETVPGKSRKFFSVSSSTNLSSSALYAIKEDRHAGKLKTHFPRLLKNTNLVSFVSTSVVYHPKRRKKHRRGFRSHGSQAKVKPFSVRVKEFFNANPLNSSGKFRFFMTWISSVESFGDRELFTVESLFKTHPNGCLIIAWYNQLMQGNVYPGEVSLGQNLSNLLRLELLYRFGGIYLDTDILVLKSFKRLRNTIGAQTINHETRNWSRLNNAVMIFDKGHRLLYKFIEEFAFTFDGNKWGHNGPYLVSRVVSRITGRPGYNFNVLPPIAFYPVYWNKIGSLFQGPKNETHSKWLIAKLSQIRSQSFTLHLWNKQSRGFEVEKGSIIERIMFDSCVFCNSSSFASL